MDFIVDLMDWIETKDAQASTLIITVQRIICFPWLNESELDSVLHAYQTEHALVWTWKLSRVGPG